MPLCQGNKMIASNASWIKKSGPSQESFCILPLLSMLIAAPAFLMIRLLEPELVLPAFSILLCGTDCARIGEPIKHIRITKTPAERGPFPPAQQGEREPCLNFSAQMS